MPPLLPSYFSSGHRAALVLLPAPSSAARSMPRLSSGRLARRRSPTVPEAVGHGKRMGGGMPPWLHVEREPTLPIRPPQGCPPPPTPQIQSARAPRTSSAVHRPRRSRAPPPRSPPGSVKSSRARQREAMAACWGHSGRTSRIARHRPSRPGCGRQQAAAQDERASVCSRAKRWSSFRRRRLVFRSRSYYCSTNQQDYADEQDVVVHMGHGEYSDVTTCATFVHLFSTALGCKLLL